MGRHNAQYDLRRYPQFPETRTSTGSYDRLRRRHSSHSTALGGSRNHGRDPDLDGVADSNNEPNREPLGQLRRGPTDRGIHHRWRVDKPRLPVPGRHRIDMPGTYPAARMAMAGGDINYRARGGGGKLPGGEVGQPSGFFVLRAPRE